ncbi:MAG: DNA polymerase I 5'-3' exonuclease domain, partial [uncultured Nocardioides sp.]
GLRRPPAPPRHRFALLPCLLRRAGLGEGAGRDAGQRGAWTDGLHQQAGGGVRPQPPRLLLGRRLAAAVARRPHPLLQGSPGRRGRARGRPGRRGGAGPARGAGARHPGGAGGVRHPGRRAPGDGGGRRHRHPRHRGGDAGRHRHRRSRPVPAGRRRGRGPGALHRAWSRPARAGRQRVGARQVRRGRGAVRRLRDPARRQLRRAARCGGGRGQDRRHPAGPLPGHRGRPGRGLRPGLRPGAGSARQDQGSGGLPLRGPGRGRRTAGPRPGIAGPLPAAHARRPGRRGRARRALGPRLLRRTARRGPVRRAL